MRIITGIARGCKLETLDGEATRPTAERVKEALFSMFQFDMPDAYVLDLFAGSGQLGLEALSRGAEKAHFVDKSAEATDIIKANAKKTRLFDKCRVMTMDYEAYLRSAKGDICFDFIFLDPPYRSGMLKKALQMIADSKILAQNGRIIAEDEIADIFEGDQELSSEYEIVKQNRYGRVFITVLTKK